MRQIIRVFILISIVMAIAFSSGCIVPEKDKPAPVSSQSGSTNYLVPGTGSVPQHQSPVGTGNPVISSISPTPTTPIPDEMRSLIQVPTYTVTSAGGQTYRNLSFLVEPTQTSPVVQEIYTNEFSLKDYTVAYAYELNNPPLVINFDIKPRIDSRTIWYESKSGSYDANGNRADVYITTPQISPDAWFEIIVRDKATGQITLDDGYGKTFGGDTKRTVSVRSSGDYQIEMSGNQVNVTVKMYITKPTT